MKPENTYKRTRKPKNLPQRKKSRRKVKDSVCSYLRLEDHTYLSYKEIAEMVRAELGSKTSANSVAWYYSKYRKTEKLLARTKPDNVITIDACIDDDPENSDWIHSPK